MDQFYQREPISQRGISVVMPTWNEADRLESCVARAVQLLVGMERSYEIIIVNAGSTDRTQEVAQGLAESNGRIHVIRHELSQGRGSALRSGFEAAKYPLVWQLEVAEQCAVDDLKRMLEAVDHVDVVCGRRLRRMGMVQRWSDWLCHIALRVVFAVPVRDPCCGFKLFRRAALRTIPIQSNSRFANAEILAKATFLHMLIDEVVLQTIHEGSDERAWPGEEFRRVFREAVQLFRRPRFRL